MIWFRLTALLLVLLLPAVGSARWEGPWDNKKVEALELLDMNGLFNEGYEVCARRAVVVATPRDDDQLDPVYFAAWDYLSIIEGVVREKSGGHLPTWMRELSFAHTTKDCQEIFRSFVHGDDIEAETKPATSVSTPAGAAAGATAARPKPTPLSTKPVAPRRAVRPRPPAKKPTPWIEPPPRWIAPPLSHEGHPTPLPTHAAAPMRPAPTKEEAARQAAPLKAAPAPRPTAEITDDLPPWLMPKRH